jgi:hypothetical protein
MRVRECRGPALRCRRSLTGRRIAGSRRSPRFRCCPGGPYQSAVNEIAQYDLDAGCRRMRVVGQQHGGCAGRDSLIALFPKIVWRPD